MGSESCLGGKQLNQLGFEQRSGSGEQQPNDNRPGGGGGTGAGFRTGDTLSAPFFPPSPEMQRQPAVTPCRDMLDFTIPTLTPPPPPHPAPLHPTPGPAGLFSYSQRCPGASSQMWVGGREGPSAHSDFPLQGGQKSLGRGLCSDASTHPHLDSWEGDRRGGIGSNHQGNKCGPKVTKHVGQLKDKKQGKLLLKDGQTG